MKTKLKTFCRMSIWVLLCATIAGAQQSASLAPETVKQIEAVITSEQAKLKIPGLSVAIASGGQVRFAKGFGHADLENNVAAKATTLFRTGSIAKPLTATAVMQLVEQGKLDLDAPIQKYCQAFPEKPWPVTARQLLGHLAGVRHYKGGRKESYGTELFASITDSLRTFKDEPLLHEPGTKYEYTTYGFSVLGCAIEGASGKSYREYMQESVFKPAGLMLTRLDDQHLIIPDRSRGYQQVNLAMYPPLPPALKDQAPTGAIVNAALHDTSMKVPGGGLLSTAEDLARFVLALKRGALVKSATLEQMWTSQKTKDGKETGYGMGWQVSENNGMKLVLHTGNQAGSSSYLSFSPERGIAIVVMSNLQDARLDGIVRGIAQVMLALKE
jgi:CubicO group peptidase (beta-lactamase class C family)